MSIQFFKNVNERPRFNHYQIKLTINIATMSNRNAKGYSIRVIHCVQHVHFRLVANDNKK